MSSPTPIIVWCHPRSVSSAFERAFMQRPDTRSYHEPLSMPFYYGEKRPCHRYDDDACKATSEGTLKSVLAETESGVEENVTVGQHEKTACRYIFIKDMAQYVFSAGALRSLHPDSTVYKPNDKQAAIAFNDPLENPTILPIDLLRRFKHTFLMRTPKKSVPSYWKCVQDGAAGFAYFDAAEAGYVELKLLYDWMANPKSTFHTAEETNDAHLIPGQVQAQPMPPPLVDASDLLARPDDVVARYCAAIGVPFDDGMLSWESGTVNAFNSWQGYHTAAQNSTGFKRETPVDPSAEQAETFLNGSSRISDHAFSPSSANLDSYNYLYAFRSIKTA
ncbi:uncharacterized protein FA14DRAFT_166128 [Meira miltonrushii]|uniref:Uncharacterized protein n=1 Tax=Meira miltonrushii TaxID=1280837 RepID=A0A316V7T3_9BASI|nr:uncharacterized protein FA14DRAFT_166128 [Meira miltonrushii]PWN31505.1 hypothetical protein FA14DRAFT_166128 [Meira miltonrushii]